MVGDGAGAHIHKFGQASKPEIPQLAPCWPHNPTVVRAILTLRMRHADATDELDLPGDGEVSADDDSSPGCQGQ